MILYWFQITISAKAYIEVLLQFQMCAAGAPLIIHPGRNPKAPFEILDVLEQAGADISRTAMSHLDRTISDVNELLKLAQRGCYLEFDLFGIEVSNYQVNFTYINPV